MSNTPLDPVRLARVRELATRVGRPLQHHATWLNPANATEWRFSGGGLAEYLAECDPAFLLSLIEAAEGAKVEESPRDHDVLFEERRRLRECLFAFTSAIKSGEDWSRTLADMKDRALQPWENIRHELRAAKASSTSPV